VIQSIKPYVSSQDIDKGARWSSDIAQELDASTYGVICLTPDNLSAPWICFEAGALSKTIDKSRVAPFLFQVKRSEVQGPLLQFQSVLLEKDEVLRLLKSINRQIDESERLAEATIERSFSVWWPQLEKDLGAIKGIAQPKPKSDAGEPGASQAILEEILELSRAQQRLLSDPRSFLPAEFMDSVLHAVSRSRLASHERHVLEMIHKRAMRLEDLLRREEGENLDLSEARHMAAQIHNMVHDADSYRKRRRPSIADDSVRKASHEPD
jgi:hypothetical protein